MNSFDPTDASSQSDQVWFAEPTSLLETIIQSSHDAIIVKDLEGIIKTWNAAATRIFGYLAAEIIGQPILRLFPERLRAEEDAILLRLRAGQQISQFQTFRVRKDGQEILVSLNISPVRDAQGEVIGISEVVRDVTDQKQWDNARSRLAAIVDSAEDAILSKDLNGIITSWNQAAQSIFGYTQEEIVGLSVLTLIPEDLRSEEVGILQQIRAGERIEHYITARLTKGGERIDVSLTISPLHDAAGNVVGASKILRNITERKRLEQSLFQAQRLAASGKMAATIAHEINNPLEAVLNLVFLARLKSTEVQVQGHLLAAEREVSRLAEITKQTLGFYRELNQASLVSLPALLEEALKIYECKFEQTGIRIVTSFQSPRQITVRRGELMQVISNLILNAAHAMPEGGTLRACVEESVHDGKDALLMTIEDTGVGIPAENMKRVFEPFFTTRATIGTGIGLWIARQFIEAHGGKLELSSSIDPVAHGTRICIHLPFENPYSAQQP